MALDSSLYDPDESQLIKMCLLFTEMFCFFSLSANHIEMRKEEVF